MENKDNIEQKPKKEYINPFCKPEVQAKIREKMKEKYKDKEFLLKRRQAIIEHYKTHEHHTKGKPKSEEQKKKMSESRKKWLTENPELAKQSFEKSRITNITKGTHKNEKHINWHGGIDKINVKRTLPESKKEEIRKRDGYRCQQCFRHQSELKNKLDTHHIDFNKLNDADNNLITLCHSCHSQLSYDRDNWTSYFQQKMIERGI